jgi:spore maturation protein CgeB
VRRGCQVGVTNSIIIVVKAPNVHPFSDLRVLTVAPVSCYNSFNTSIHRVNALRRLGVDVQVLDTSQNQVNSFALGNYRLRHWLFRKGVRVYISDLMNDNERLRAAAISQQWDILWLDKGMTIRAETLGFFRQQQPECVILGFSPDDMGGRHNQSQQFLEHLQWYNVFFTTKSYNVRELLSLGCRRVELIGNGYDPREFRLLTPTVEEVMRLGGDVGFIGSYEHERAEIMRHLAEAGISLRIWGGSWRPIKQPPSRMKLEHQPLYHDDYALACQSFKINLCFLRKTNRDLQTTRSVEIPACGGFMLAERTEEHLELFKEGEEAEFFDGIQELLDKCRYYLHHESQRLRIAKNGLRRCIESGYSNDKRVESMLTSALDVVNKKY